MKYVVETPKNKKVRQKKASNFLGVPYYAILLILIIFPFLIMIMNAFTSTSGNFFGIKLTLEHFHSFFSQASFVADMVGSLIIALISTIVILLIGYPVAYIITKLSTRMQVLMLTLITSPIWINMLIRVNALKQVIMFISPDFLGTTSSIILGNIFIFLPFMVLPIYTVLSKLDKSLLESASDLGANSFQTFIKVIIPLSFSGIISGCMMVFLPAATSLVIPEIIGDGRPVYSIGRLIDDAIKSGKYGYGAAISIVIGLILIILMTVLKRFDKYEGAAEHE